MSNFQNKFFEKNIRWQLHSFINYLLYPEFRDSWNLKKIIKSNKTIITVFTVIAISLVSMFYTGKAVNRSYTNMIEQELDKRDSVVSSLVSTLSDKDSAMAKVLREYLNYKIINEAKVDSRYVSYLKEVPDSLFFLMIKESDKYKIPYVIFFRIMERESKFQFVDNTEGSSAKGYMQVVRATFKSYYDKLGLKGGHTKGNNIRVAANLISTMHSFWKNKFRDNRTAWEYTLAEYGCGRAPMTKKDGSYIIPDSSRWGVNYVMKYYNGK